ncbi:MAG: segregation/condensation protein A [Phycisphaerae bacterium]
MTEEYRVQLDVFSGPMDLLLYLIRRDEIDIQDIPIARLTEQYLGYVHLLEQLDPDASGEFLVMAASLIEIKSRAILPTPPIEALDEEDDPRALLVRQLLEYKRFKDAARTLGSAADERRKRFVRAPADLPPELQGVELEDVEVWDLLEAFSRVMTAIGKGPGVHAVQYDERPIEFHAARIVERLAADGPFAFHTLFEGTRLRAEIVGLFLALLELIRNGRVRAEQDRAHATIYLFLLEPADEAEADEALSASNAPSVPDPHAPAPAAPAAADIPPAADSNAGHHPTPETIHE